MLAAWREEDARVYMYRLLIEFARTASKHRDDGTMVGASISPQGMVANQVR